MQKITMPTSIFQEIDSLHAQCAGMDKATKLGWLAGMRRRLYQLVDQLAMHVRAAGGFMNDAERAYAHDLLAMIQEVEAEGAKTVNELRNEALNELRHEAINELAKLIICG